MYFEENKMPPKARYTREEIVQAALNIVAEKGMAALNARDLGVALGTSTRPVFTAFKNMNELISEVKLAAMRRFESYARNEPGVPAFKNVGLQMINFATNEPKLFQVLYLSEREQTSDFEALFGELGDTAGYCIDCIMRDYALNHDEAMFLFKSVWLYTFGIGVLIASKVVHYDEAVISDMLTRQFMAVMGLIKSGRAFSPLPDPSKMQAPPVPPSLSKS